MTRHDSQRLTNAEWLRTAGVTSNARRLSCSSLFSRSLHTAHLSINAIGHWPISASWHEVLGDRRHDKTGVHCSVPKRLRLMRREEKRGISRTSTCGMLLPRLERHGSDDSIMESSDQARGAQIDERQEAPSTRLTFGPARLGLHLHCTGILTQLRYRESCHHTTSEKSKRSHI